VIPPASGDRSAARARPDRRRPRTCAIGQRRHRVHAGAPPHLILHCDRDAMVNHEESRVLHEALSAVGAQSIYVLIAGAGHEGPEFVAPAITATVAGFLAEKLG
jgi:acetyl esterase/lipase